MVIYTVGKKSIYEDYIKNDPNAAKTKGGSVWQIYQDAEKFAQDGYAVYGVDAEWDDTIQGGKWNSLKEDAKLVKLSLTQSNLQLS